MIGHPVHEIVVSLEKKGLNIAHSAHDVMHNLINQVETTYADETIKISSYEHDYHEAHAITAESQAEVMRMYPEEKVNQLFGIMHNALTIMERYLRENLTSGKLEACLKETYPDSVTQILSVIRNNFGGHIPTAMHIDTDEIIWLLPEEKIIEILLANNFTTAQARFVLRQIQIHEKATDEVIAIRAQVDSLIGKRPNYQPKKDELTEIALESAMRLNDAQKEWKNQWPAEERKLYEIDIKQVIARQADEYFVESKRLEEIAKEKSKRREERRGKQVEGADR
jgi:hypothetical protein